MSPAAPARAALAACLFLALGCGPAVREDRAIAVGADGRAAFPHGRLGVYVTDPDTGEPRNVYQPGDEDLAVSPPVWDPSGRRMIFAVATAVDGVAYGTGGEDAAGTLYAGGPVRYACWLYEPDREKPVRLFGAACGHVGYVAAGLAVRWNPDGRRIDFVALRGGLHHLATFDPANRRVEKSALAPAEDLVFGSTPGPAGRRFALRGTASPADGGVWVEDQPGGGWWRVPDAGWAGPNLEDLRRRLPHPSPDGSKLAFAGPYSLRVCDLATRQTEVWYDADTPLADLHWRPDGARIGLIDAGRLRSVGPPGTPRGDLTDDRVVSFAGWDPPGRRFAFVAAEPLPYSDGALWATLFLPNPDARTALHVADADGRARAVVSGLRVTFPHWSPAGDRLSAWLTVEPPYRLLTDPGAGMRPGDPAALIDPDTGAVTWLPVDGTEHAQIAHVELRAGRLDMALREFDKAAAALPDGRKADWMFFRALALRKTGRDAAARDALARFEPQPVRPDAPTPAVLPRHRFAAEAFVSLDTAGDGVEFLRREADAAGSDAERLSAELALCQLLLLTDRRPEFAAEVADRLLPLAARVLPAAGSERVSIDAAVALTVLPLAVGEFARALPEASLRRVAHAACGWGGGNGDTDFTCLLVRRTCGRQLGDSPLAQRAGSLLATHPAWGRWGLPPTAELGPEHLQQIRMTLLLPELIRQGLQRALASP